ncbi:hypothetical protein D3C86_2218140 [compost metagenome]
MVPVPERPRISGSAVRGIAAIATQRACCGDLPLNRRDPERMKAKPASMTEKGISWLARA